MEIAEGQRSQELPFDLQPATNVALDVCSMPSVLYWATFPRPGKIVVMSTLKLAGILLIVLSIVETFLWRYLTARNQRLQKLAPVLSLSTAGIGLIGLGLLIFG